MRNIKLIGIAALATSFGMCVALGFVDEPKSGDAAPAFVGKDSEGKSIDLKAENAKGPVILYFISNTCPVSKAATPQYQKMAKAFTKEGIRFIGVINTNKDGFDEWNRIHAAIYPVVLDPSYKIIRSYGVTKAPSMVLIGKDGKVVKFWTGYSKGFLDEQVTMSAKALGRGPSKLDFQGAPAQWMAG